MTHKNEKRGSKIIIIWSGPTVYQEKLTDSVTKLVLKPRTSHNMTSNKLLHIYSSHI